MNKTEQFLNEQLFVLKENVNNINSVTGDDLNENQLILHELIGKGFADQAYRKAAILRGTSVKNLTKNFADRMTAKSAAAINNLKDVPRRVVSAAKRDSILSNVTGGYNFRGKYSNPAMQNLYDQARNYGDRVIQRQNDIKTQNNLKKIGKGAALVGVGAGLTAAAIASKKKKEQED